MPTLVYRKPGQQDFATVTLHKSMTSIGSGLENDVRIRDPEIEESHAVLHFDGSTFTLKAVSRKAPVLINGKTTKKKTLEHGDEIRLGHTLLTFNLLTPPQPQRSETPERGPARDGRQAMEQLRRLVAFSEQLLQRNDLGDVLEALMDHIIEITRAEKGMLILVEQGEQLAVKVARNLHRENVQNALAQVSDSIITKVLRSRRPLIVSDALQDDEFNASQSVINLSLCSVMCVPLLDKGALMGVLYVGNSNVANLFTQEHLELLTIFAAQASLLIANALLLNALRLDNQLLNRRLADLRFGEIIGACDAMREIFRKIERVAATPVSILIQGETGTGKELIARELHNRSERASGPFITINCGAIPENLLESELFGHVKGAFTGAIANKPGRFHQAHKGTIFLDELGEMPLNLQVKLLRVLQERVVTRVGDTRPESIDIRVVAATNKRLDEEVRDGRFREDLFYRLNVVTLHLPPLRERDDDIVLIGNYLLKRFCEEFHVGAKTFSPEAAIAMKKYAWPGNIRQLENRIKKAVILSDRALLTPADLDLQPEDLEEVMNLNDARERFQRRYVHEILARNNGNRTKTARDLGVDPRTIFRYLEREKESGEPEL